MDPIDLLFTGISFLQQIPSVGPYLAEVVSIAGMVAGAVTAFVAIWHSVIMFMKAIRLETQALKLEKIEGDAEGVLKKYILPILNRLSALPLPQKPKL